jgi:3-phenylpropionate/cinnamic acid dioxygenase small subunit
MEYRMSIALTDRTELADLLVRHGLWLDECRWDEAPAIFTPDATVATPGGTAEGIEALTAQARKNHDEYARTQHITTNVLIDLDGDRATVRVNEIVAVVRDDAAARLPKADFTLGGRARFEAVRTPDGWRFARLEMTPVWGQGNLPI